MPSLTYLQIIPQDILRKYIMYARDKIRPKLFDLDQEKLSKLFADLRRESMATGSFPITVRHLESMIRMAEASAKMSLREYVRADDIDMAISVAVGSFVSAQKMSIKKTLERVSSVRCVVLLVLMTLVIGLPQIFNPITRSRRAPIVPPRSTRQGQSQILPASTPSTTGARHHQDVRTGRKSMYPFLYATDPTLTGCKLGQGA